MNPLLENSNFISVRNKFQRPYRPQEVEQKRKEAKRNGTTHGIEDWDPKGGGRTWGRPAPGSKVGGRAM